jgi:lysophospholipase L1-like esterase
VTPIANAHAALLGDSIFDSRPYLHGQPDMAARLAKAAGCRATLLAVSGSRLADVPRQLARLPSDATHIVVSAGGNDLLDLGRQLRSGAGDLVQRFGRAAALLQDFNGRYAQMCRAVAERELIASLCTIYEPPVDDPVLRRLGAAALQMVNTAIETEARGCGLAVIDLRATCREPADFFDPIHPSAHGADKIAAVLARWMTSTQPRIGG